MDFALRFAFRGLPVTAALFACAAVCAAPKGRVKRYHLDLVAVSATAQVQPAIAKIAVPRVEAEARKILANDPQVVVKLEGAPDPQQDGEAYRRFLAKANVAGSYRVRVEITQATEERTQGKSSPMLGVHLALRMLGERVPGGTLGLSGESKASIQQEVGQKISDADRAEAWGSVAEVVVQEALKSALEELDKPHGAKGHGAHRH